MSQTATTTEAPKRTWVVRLQVTDEPLPISTEAQDHQHALKVANDFRARDNWQSLLAIAANYAVIGTCVLLADHGLPPAISPTLHWAVYILSCLLIASRLRGFENLVHEASHYNLFRQPSTHYALQFLYAFPVFRVLQDYRRGHLLHHKHLGDPTRDPDLVRIVDLGLDRVPDAPVYYLLGLPFSGAIHWEYLTTTFVDFWTLRDEYPAKAVFWAAVLAGAVSSPAAARVLALYYAVPLLLVLPVLRYWAEAAEHIGLDLRGKFGSSRSNLGFFHKWFSECCPPASLSN